MKQLFLALAMLVFGVAQAATPMKDLTVCTGGEGGFYESLGTAIGKDIAEKTTAKLEVLNTGGSVENAELLKDSSCVLGIVQADAVMMLPLPSDIKVTDAHVETVYWLYGEKGISDFGDMEKGNNAKEYGVAYVTGSGAEVTLNMFMQADDDYKDIRKIEFDDWDAAASAVAQGHTLVANVPIKIAGMIYVGRQGFISQDILENYSDAIKIGEINDDTFASVKDVNGNPLYTACDIPGKFANGLKTSTVGAPDTYCLRAQIVYNNEYHKALPSKEARAVARFVNKGTNKNIKAVR